MQLNDDDDMDLMDEESYEDPDDLEDFEHDIGDDDAEWQL